MGDSPAVGDRGDDGTGEEAFLARITVYPLKSLDGLDLDHVDLGERGALDLDREYALFDADGDYVNGKAEPAVHRLRSAVDVDSRTVTLSAPDRDSATFDLPTETGAETDALDAWLTGYFGYSVTLRRNESGGFPDDTVAAGPTVISTATLRTVASWFDGIDTDEMRRRLRPNLEVGGVPAFWEDRLFDDRDHVVSFSVGGVAFEGVNPCQRCVVPSRNPDTGDSYDGFQRRFVERRRETLPAWSGGDWFDHYFRVMVNTSVPESSWGQRLEVGDTVTVGETRLVE